jgi:hypothetical protein
MTKTLGQNLERFLPIGGGRSCELYVANLICYKELGVAMSATRESKALFLRSGGKLADSRVAPGHVCAHLLLALALKYYNHKAVDRERCGQL